MYLCVDQLRGEQVALKVVHPHLAADPKIRRRLQREVRAATLLQHEAALVPWDVHELDGFLALSMPYHAGRTLREHVALVGPLPIAEVRTLGSRVAAALAEAHRSGLLHLDVSANNILVEGGRLPMLMDFGLSRAQADATRSTTVVGTAGFMAPERMGSERPLPSADLYGLGCVLYLALTGRPPFPTDHAMAALQAQLAERFTPVKELRSDCPQDLADTVAALLRADPAARPQSASALADALQHGSAAGSELERPARAGSLAHLEPGEHAVIVRERPEDHTRRNLLRIENKSAPDTVEAAVVRRARQLMQGVLTYVGVEQVEARSPERSLARAVAEEAQLPPATLVETPVLLAKEFLLVDHLSKPAAMRLANEVRIAGFQASVVAHTSPESEATARRLRAMVVIGWLITAICFSTPLKALAFGLVWWMVATTIYVATRLSRGPQRFEELPVAYGTRLDRWLTTPQAGRFDLGQPATEGPVAQPSAAGGSRGAALLSKATAELDRLTSAIEAGQPNAIAAADLRSTTRALRERAEELATQVDRLDTELQTSPEDLSWIEPRVSRLKTKQRAGESVDHEEIARLEASLLAGRQAEAQRDRLESRHLAAIAGLLEIASTATRVRRDLLANPEPTTASSAVSALERQAAALDRARRELEP